MCWSVFVRLVSNFSHIQHFMRSGSRWMALNLTELVHFSQTPDLEKGFRLPKDQWSQETNKMYSPKIRVTLFFVVSMCVLLFNQSSLLFDVLTFCCCRCVSTGSLWCHVCMCAHVYTYADADAYRYADPVGIPCLKPCSASSDQTGQVAADAKSQFLAWLGRKDPHRSGQVNRSLQNELCTTILGSRELHIHVDAFTDQAIGQVNYHSFMDSIFPQVINTSIGGAHGILELDLWSATGLQIAVRCTFV